MSRTRFNKNGTVSILGLTKDEYNAITTVIYASQQCFSEQEENGEYYSNDDFLCTLSQEEKEALDKLSI